MLKLNYFLADIFILSAEKQPIKLSWRKIEWLQTNTLNGDWGKDEGEVINTNTIYTVVYNWDTHSLSLKE